MTVTSGIGVPSLTSDSSHMSRRFSSSRLLDRSWSLEVRKEVVLGRARAPAEVWSRSVILCFTFLTLFLSSAHSQTTVDPYAQNRTALNRQIFTAAFSYIKGINDSLITGKIYPVPLPTNISDNSVELESIQVVRLRRGSLNRHGIPYNEIYVPPGVQIIQQTPIYVVLVYRKFKQYVYYNTTDNTVFLAPVVGILAYSYQDVTDYTSNYGTELTIVAAAGALIQVQLQSSRNLSPDQLGCSFYTNTVNGSAAAVVTNLTSSANCTSNSIGDFSLLGPAYHKKSNTWKIIVGSVVGGLAAFVLLVLLIILALCLKARRNFTNMEQKSDQGESLHHTWFGNSRAPSAASTRTKPVLENENA